MDCRDTPFQQQRTTAILFVLLIPIYLEINSLYLNKIQDLEAAYQIPVSFGVMMVRLW